MAHRTLLIGLKRETVYWFCYLLKVSAYIAVFLCCHQQEHLRLSITCFSPSSVVLFLSFLSFSSYHFLPYEFHLCCWVGGLRWNKLISPQVSLIPSGFIPTCLIVLLWLLLLHMKFVSLCARTIWAHLEFGWIRVCEIFVFAPAWTPVLICYCTYKRVILSVHLHMSTEYALITLSMDAYKPPCVQQ